MAKVMVEVKQVDLKTFRTMFGIGAYCTTLGTHQEFSGIQVGSEMVR